MNPCAENRDTKHHEDGSHDHGDDELEQREASRCVLAQHVPPLDMIQQAAGYVPQPSGKLVVDWVPF